jgi:hypothetical protein
MGSRPVGAAGGIRTPTLGSVGTFHGQQLGELLENIVLVTRSSSTQVHRCSKRSVHWAILHDGHFQLFALCSADDVENMTSLIESFEWVVATEVFRE